MISPNLNIEEFAKTVMNEELLNIIYLAEQEAIEAFRMSQRNKGKNRTADLIMEKSNNYQLKLSNLIDYMRYKIKLKGCDEKDLSLFNKIYENNAGSQKYLA